MEHTFRIGEIADFFDIPASTLRFWEEKKIIHPIKNPENNYREYHISDLITLSDTIFYKNLGIPLKQICDMSHTTPEEHRLLFEEKIDELERQQRELLARMEKLKMHLSAIDTLHALKAHPFAEAAIDTECIVSFDLLEKDKLRKYMENPYLYSRVQHSFCIYVRIFPQCLNILPALHLSLSDAPFLFGDSAAHKLKISSTAFDQY